MRLFVAVELPDEVRDSIASRQHALRTALEDDGYRWTDPTNFHVTLAFLGEVPDGDEPRVRSITREVALKEGRFTVVVSGIGAFPAPSQPRILVAYVVGPELGRLGSAMQLALDGMGDCHKGKPHIPHVTLARANRPLEPDQRAEIHRALSSLAEGELGSFQAQSVALYRSHLGQSRPRYAVIGRFPLAG